MRTIRFGRTDVHVPAISLGTWGHGGPNVNDGNSVGWTGHDDQKAKEALVAAWRAGITHWDTADAYGNGHAEQLIGDVFSEVPRREIFLASKFGWVKGPHDHFYDPRFMREQAERSLRLMRTDVIDLYYFHHCNFGSRFDEVLEVMRRLREEGKVRFVGLSDWNASEIMKYIERVDPDVVQPYRNLVDDEYESSGLKAHVDAHDLGVAFFSPLKHGLLLGKYDAPVEFGEGDFRSGVADFRDPAAIARYKRAATETSSRMPVLNAVTGALLTGNPTACVLLGQRNVRQVEAAAGAGEALSDSDARWVRGLYGR
ncbi:MAG TPA: aldo/keto reductase [Thermoanaerobaculia bacterium]|jgi:aryl-alcohol dehydrogenase-like predicted oxidoreductase|nr:aldo/keto reductase [Thermoanaerobaculia bacterium]